MKSKSSANRHYANGVLHRLGYRSALLLPLLPPAMLVTFAVIVSMYAIAPHGLIFYGDQTPIIDWNSLSYAQRFVWYQGQVSTGYNSFTYTLPALLLFNSCGTDCTSKGMLILLAAGPGVAAYVSFHILDRNVLPLAPDTGLLRELAPVPFGLASAMYGVTFINEGFAAPLTYGISFVEIFLPILFAVSLAYIKTGRLTFLLTAAIVATFLSAAPEWILFFLILVVPMAAFFVYRHRSRLIRILFLAVGIAGANSFVIIPIIESTFHFSGGIYSSYLLPLNATPNLFEANSWYSIIDSLTIQQPALPIFHNFPATGTVLNFLLPATAFGALLSRRRQILAPVGLSALISVALTTGANPPFGMLYVYLAERAWILSVLLRNIDLWFIPLTFAYSLLILVFMSTFKLPKLSGRHAGSIAFWGHNYHITHHGNRVPIMRCRSGGFAVGAALGLAAVVILASGTMVVVGTVRPYYTPHSIPAEYMQLNEWLTSRGSNYGVIYYPTGGSYTWRNLSNDGQSDFPATISPEIPIDPTLAVSLLPYTHSIGLFMSMIGAQVFVIHNDTTTNVTSVYEDLSNQTDIHLAWRDGYISAFVNSVPAPSFRALSQIDLVLGGMNYLPLVTPPLAVNTSDIGLFFSGGLPALTGVFSGIPTISVAPPSSDLQALSHLITAATLEETSPNSSEEASSTLSNIKAFHGSVALSISPSMVYGFGSLPTIPGPFVTFSKQIAEVTVGSPNINVAPVIFNSTWMSGQQPVYFLKPNSSARIAVNATLPSGVCNSTGSGISSGVSPTFILFRENNGSISNRLVQISHGFQWIATGKCKGVISFVLPIPSTAFGEMSLIGYYYNTTNYDTVSPVDFVADAVATGLWNSTESVVNSTLIGSGETVTERVLVPISGGYAVTLSTVPLLQFPSEAPTLTLTSERGSSALCRGVSGMYCSLPAGWYNLSITRYGVMSIGDTTLLHVSSNSSAQMYRQPVVRAELVSPVQWKVSVSPNRTSVLYFAQQFDSSWEAVDTQGTLSSLPLDGYGNAFVLLGMGAHNFTIFETDQIYLDAGALLSMFSISFIAIFVFAPIAINRFLRSYRRGQR